MMIIQKKYSGVLAVILMACFSIILSVFGQNGDSLETNDIISAEKAAGLKFTPVQRDSMLDELRDNLKSYNTLRNYRIDNSIPPALMFNAIPLDFQFSQEQRSIRWSSPDHFSVPSNFEDLAFYSIRDLAELIRTRQITSTQLTRMYLDRLIKYGPQLECVITITKDLALTQAARADEEIAGGIYRGLLHGIPYGAKDLLAVEGYKTTWGAVPYQDQVIDETATVIRKLEEAGAVLVAKLTLGALAWGDVWYGGKTRNPWNPEQGSSGSSAGSASATSAGLVAFAIGSETWGSIVSPSTRCGVTGLRPTFGRVSRSGAMTLSWSMDKIGPLCRSVEDCAIVFDIIRGSDGKDQTVRDIPFNYDPEIDLRNLRIGYLNAEFEKDSLNRKNNRRSLTELRKLGAGLMIVNLPNIPVESMSFILSAEAATAFDELTRSGRDSLMVRQIKNAWPNVFRASRFIPAVEYLQANRLRYLLIQKMKDVLKNVDLYIAPSFGKNLLLTNLTGHPCVVVPNGFNKNGTPTSISFIGKLYDEATILEVARVYQQATGFHRKHPPLFR